MTYNHIQPNYAGTGLNIRKSLYEPKFIEANAGAAYAYHDYAKPELNNPEVPWNEYQSRHVHVFGGDNKNPKGLALIFHGGGGDVGYAEHSQILDKALFLAQLGFVAASVEYRRGWSNVGFTDDEIDPDSPDAQRNLFNLTTEEYQRQERSARMSFEDTELALDFLALKYPKAAAKGIIMEGTSFGGAIVLALTVMNPRAEKYRFRGAVAGFGGINAADIAANKGKLPNPKICPLVLIGGTADPIVPFWEGNFYCKGEVYGLGSAAVAALMRNGGGKALLIGTVNKGHGYGVVSESGHEQFQILETFLNNPINEDRWYKALPNKQREESALEAALAGFAIRCDYAF